MLSLPPHEARRLRRFRRFFAGLVPAEVTLGDVGEAAHARSQERLRIVRPGSAKQSCQRPLADQDVHWMCPENLDGKIMRNIRAMNFERHEVTHAVTHEGRGLDSAHGSRCWTLPLECLRVSRKRSSRLRCSLAASNPGCCDGAVRTALLGA